MNHPALYTHHCQKLLCGDGLRKRLHADAIALVHVETADNRAIGAKNLQQVPKYSITAMTPNMMEPFEFTGRYGGVAGDEADNIDRDLIRSLLKDETAGISCGLIEPGGYYAKRGAISN